MSGRTTDIMVRIIWYFIAFDAFLEITGAGIAKAGQLETGLTAFFRLALVGIIMPFMWIYKPGGVLLQGSTPIIIWTILCTLVGVWALSMCLIGYWKRHFHWAHRILLFALSLWLLFAPIHYQVVPLPAVLLLCLYNKYGLSIYRGKLTEVGSASELKRVSK